MKRIKSLMSAKDRHEILVNLKMKKRQQLVLQKYNFKILARLNWASNYIYTTKDFMTMDKVISFFYDYADHEVDLTVDGYKFLNEYYGIREIAKHLFGIDYIAYNKTVIEIKEYIKERVSSLYGVKL